MRPLAYDESLAGVLLTDPRSVVVIVVDDLGEQIRGAVGAGQAPCPLLPGRPPNESPHPWRC
jgi:hypothetical protein